MRSSISAEIERKVMAAVAQKFCVAIEHLEHPLIKQVDRVMLATEKRDLLGPEPDSWGPMLLPMMQTIVPLPPTEAEVQFLTRFKELFR